ncbi:hypothetical protein PDG61_22075 [Mycolicibacterium sp. BiH015]|uniref:hypothetical protein n=1 Tax=Mycolicibacterium sp. BiH015 TaxID=3018808 RepID=UPI0022E12011|nr:hypothetical protein [Mycolicibacterium sp. BiH015]MDA2893620.1 hypothetical protein [Mycolicibacterium sp. BiH015]
MPTLVLDRRSGVIVVEPGRIDEYATSRGYQMAPAILDGDVCVKLLDAGCWVATAQYV